MDQSSGKRAMRFGDLEKLALNLNDGKRRCSSTDLINISQDCAGESQSPIDVEWPEGNLANAQPGRLTFEGYDRVKRSILHKL